VGNLFRRTCANLGSRNRVLCTPSVQAVDGVGTTLPTTEPGTPQVAMTLAESDFNREYHAGPFSIVRFTTMFLVWGQAQTAATITAKFTRNGAQQGVNTPVSPTANQYWSFQAMIPNIAPGDTLEGYFWSNQANSTWRGRSLSIIPARIQCVQHWLGSNVLVTFAGVGVSQSTGYPAGSSTDNNMHRFYDRESIVNGGTFYPHCWYLIPNTPFFWLENGESSVSIRGLTSAVYYPYYYASRFPTELSWVSVQTERK